MGWLQVVMQLVDAMVKTTEGQLNESAELLQEILKAAADERGEWQLPLSAEKQAAMRRVRGIGVAAGQALARLSGSGLPGSYLFVRLGFDTCWSVGAVEDPGTGGRI